MFAGVSLAIVWGAMAERTKLWVYFAFGAIFTLIYSLVSHWIWSPDGWLFKRGMQDFAGSTVVHYQGALAGLAGAMLLGPRIGKFGKDGKSNAIPGHNMAFTTLGVIILWFGWFGFNPGSTLGVDFGGVGFFAYVALNTNLAAAAGVLGAVVTSWIVIKKPDLSMMLNGAIAALVAITAACAFVAPWAAILIGFVAGVIVVVGVLAVDRIGIDDPVGAIAAHGMSGMWGTLALGFLTVPSLAEKLDDRARAACSTAAACTSSASRRSASLPSARSRSRVSFAILFLFKITFGIRTEPEVEEAGLDVSEHGMWGYPEFYIPVPGGYGTETHGHLVGAAARATRSRVRLLPHSSPAASRAPGDPRQVWRGGVVGRPAHHPRRSRLAPPATAGSRITVAPSATFVSSPSNEPDVGAVDEDVEELRQLVALVEDALAQRRIGRDEALEHLAHRLAVDLELAVVARFGAEDRGDADGRHRPLERNSYGVAGRRSSSRPDAGQLGEEPRPDRRERDRRDAAEHDRRHGAEQRRGGARLERAELVRGADEHHSRPRARGRAARRA